MLDYHIVLFSGSELWSLSSGKQKDIWMNTISWGDINYYRDNVFGMIDWCDPGSLRTYSNKSYKNLIMQYISAASIHHPQSSHQMQQRSESETEHAQAPHNLNQDCIYSRDLKCSIGRCGKIKKSAKVSAQRSATRLMWCVLNHAMLCNASLCTI
jgi:hypothetical protein